MAHPPIRIETDGFAIVFGIESGRLVQLGFGPKGQEAVAGPESFPGWGDGWVYEPALHVTHSDGNTSLDLRFVIASERDGATQITLKDPRYPFFVDLCFRPYPALDVVETWTKISHDEPGNVVLQSFASSSPDFGPEEIYLTQFRGDWNDEMHMEEERLGYGLKTLDSKLMVRAHQFRAPWFLLGRGGPAREDEGEVFGGSLAWSGSFRFAFERLPQGSLRAICGINPFASAYHLKPGEAFETPRMVWGWSGKGTGRLSRNLHAWVRRNALREGDQTRSILLNNWEATYFKFDEAKIVSLFDGAKALGIEMFLLDDGWFGAKYPRDGDDQALGDWTPDPKKLPHGVRALTEAAKSRGLQFGIWLEPEMVSPRSELFEAHPDWAIGQSGREPEPQRHQLVLDLTRRDVQDYVFGLVDKVLTDDPDIGYVKWDCNRYVTQPGSSDLAADEQTHLPTLYVRALYEVFGRVLGAHPKVQIMMCSGGGGRVDYAAMQYAHELWPSDNTDPARRIFIQWGYSYFFPPLAHSDHVTHMGHRPLPFAFAVAMSGRLGLDMDVDALSESDRSYAKEAIAAYKGLRDVVQLGVQYRLESPYDGPRSAVMNTLGNRAVVFVYSLGDSPAAPLRLKGLDPGRTYHVRQVLGDREITLKGTTLLREGLPLAAMGEFESAIFELTAL